MDIQTSPAYKTLSFFVLEIFVEWNRLNIKVTFFNHQ